MPLAITCGRLRSVPSGWTPWTSLARTRSKPLAAIAKVVETVGIEPTTSRMQNGRSTDELRPHVEVFKLLMPEASYPQKESNLRPAE